MDQETKRRHPPRGLVLFGMFFKIGLFTFGGGWSIISQLQDEFVEKRQWLTQSDLMDIVSVGRSMPGIMIVNISVLLGYRVLGVPGSILSAMGLTLPSVLVLTAVTLFYNFIRGNLYVERAMAGVRASVVPIILAAALKLRRASLPNLVSCLLALAALLLSLFSGISNLVIILLGVLAGLLYRGGKSDAVS
ncbi:MAG: chromate transporter [Oscillospiraceae bacterium]|nr:chromate transporter [Oscillospiraceae bacterium]